MGTCETVRIHLDASLKLELYVVLTNEPMHMESFDSETHVSDRVPSFQCSKSMEIQRSCI